jgi:hypothetical protein
MKNTLYYIPYTFLIFVLAFSTLFSIEYWPITNFSVFRTPKRIGSNEIEVFFWYYFDSEEKTWVRIPRRHSHAHDSFSASIGELLAQSKDQDEIDRYVKFYLTGELKVQGIFRRPIRVKVIQKKVNYSSKVGNPLKECFQLQDQAYCVNEEILSEIVI